MVSDEREVARENSTGVPSSTKALGASLNTPVLDLGPESWHLQKMFVLVAGCVLSLAQVIQRCGEGKKI